MNRKEVFAKSAENKGQKVAIFVGSDLAALLLLNATVPMIKARGFEPVVFFPRHPSPSNYQKKRLAEQPELEEIAFYERGILESIYEVLDKSELQSSVNYTPNQLGVRRGIASPELIDDINDPDFVQEIKEQNFVGALSMRCYQIFGKELLSYFHEKGEKGFIWNIHPGKLSRKGPPEIEYRGIYTPLRVMLDDRDSNSWTLHVIDEHIDTGPIIASLPQKIDYEKPMIDIYLRYTEVGAALITQTLEKFADGEHINAEPANHPRSRLYSFPKPEEIQLFKDRGLKFVDPESMVQFYIKTFVNTKERVGRLTGPVLERRIRSEMKKFYDVHPNLGRDLDFNTLKYTSENTGNLFSNDNENNGHSPSAAVGG